MHENARHREYADHLAPNGRILGLPQASNRSPLDACYLSVADAAVKAAAAGGKTCALGNLAYGGLPRGVPMRVIVRVIL